ncbi:helix-turn-helix domain-containing protein [Quadrisphaera sp. DSM 44207]|uniref:helix-turn-helix domain-containing protein n=1 Tax=Quadrisphaera sp. DSM 44207 TaxID=1881057 RepID=UPI0008883D05|nr:helix-turn-helix transcriptional regulator [Quadrisphaera sp. DSM 44207]SDQ18280.1 Helix-turn-helix [Quadrisphaera sp. DSM 44207]
MDVEEPWRTQASALGSFIRAQRRLADLSLRELATMTQVSNAYLSQVERGLHQPSVRVLGAIAAALDVPAHELLAEAGFGGRPRAGAPGPGADGTDGAGGARTDERTDRGTTQGTTRPPSTEAAILADPALTPEQQQALLGVYRSFVARS